MATFTYTSLFSQLNGWPGTLFEVTTPVTVLTNTATSFSFRFPATGVDFPNYRVVITGTGFDYDGGTPVDGDVNQVQVRNGSGQVLFTISGITAGTLANDLSLLYLDMFGAEGYQSGQGPWPSGKMAWSHLLSGNDTFNGTAGNDDRWLPGTDAGNDTYNMQGGDDWVQGGIGSDTINGGDGFDHFGYQQTMFNEGMPATRGVTINVAAGTAQDPWGFTDHFTNVEAFAGSMFRDTLIGSNTGRDEFQGSRGADTIDGGDITMNGAVQTDDKKDVVIYADDYWDGARRGIIVDLETAFVGGSIRGTIRDGFGTTDTVIDIERVQGTRFNDLFMGSRVGNIFAGGEGVDSYDGGGGVDGIRFAAHFGDGPQTGVRVNLALANNQIINDGFGNTETALNIEELEGTDFNDQLRGNALSNFLEGDLGADTLAGAAGADEFHWGGQDFIGQGDRILDFDTTGADKDHLSFDHDGFAGMTGVATVVNGANATAAVGTFVYNVANHTLYWDDDGTGGHAKVAIAVLDGVTALNATHFWL